MYDLFRRIYWITILLLGVTVLVTLILMLSQPLWLVLISGLLIVAAAACFWTAHTFIFSRPKSLHTLDVQIVHRDGRSILADQSDYIYANLLFKLALRHPNSRFAWLVAAGQRPVLVSTVSKSQLEKDVAEMQDFHSYQVVFREDGLPGAVTGLLSGPYVYALAALNDAQFAEERAEPLSFTDLLNNADLGALGVMVNLSLMPRFAPMPLGNVAVILPKGKNRSEESEYPARIGSCLPIVRHVQVERSPFVRWYGEIIHILGGMVLSENLVEIANIVPFPPIKDTSAPARQKQWMVSMSGQGNSPRVPALLRQKSLVLQNISGVVNPGVLWATHIAKTSTEPFVVIDFDGSAAGYFHQALEDLPSTSFASVRVPAENPDYILNLLSIWPGIADDFHGLMGGVLLHYLRKFVDYATPKESQATRDSVTTLLQGMFLLAIANRQTHDLSGLAALNDVPAPMSFLISIRETMRRLVYQHDADPFLSQVWNNMTALGQPIQYEQTLVGHDPSPVDLTHVNILQDIGTRFISDTGNVILSQAESRYSPSDFTNVVFDLSSWKGKPENLFLQHAVLGVLYLLEAKRALGFPDTHLLVTGISSLSPDAQEIVTGLLADHMLTASPTQYLLVADRAVTPGYTAWAKRKLLSDIYLFRIREVAGFAEWLAPLKIVESLYTLPKSVGYLMRTAQAGGKLIYQPANITTGIPKMVESAS